MLFPVVVRLDISFEFGSEASAWVINYNVRVELASTMTNITSYVPRVFHSTEIKTEIREASWKGSR